MRRYRALYIAIGVVVSVVLAESRVAHALSSCTFNNLVAVTNGLPQQVSRTLSFCSEFFSFTARGATAGATSIDALEGHIGLTENASGNATVELSVTQEFPVTAQVPNIFAAFMGANQPVDIGGVTYLLDAETVQLTGIAHEVTTGQPEGAKIDFTASITLGAVAGQPIVQTTTEVGPCGSTFTDPATNNFPCPGKNSRWTVQADRTGTVLPVVDFTVDLSASGELDTIAPNQAVLNASDTFEITQMALLDANGVVIPGVVFTGDDGTVFPSVPFPGGNGSIPEPATLVLLGIGLAGLRFSRRARKH